jgi:prepilin-type N-terminal cleavage/methylation domain-containing protein
MKNRQFRITNRISWRHRQCGFTLLELSTVLVIIAIIVGITTVGIDVYRNAIGVRIYSEFIQGWQGAYNTYITRSGNVEPGDTQNPPAGYVNAQMDSELCDDSIALPLSSTMLSMGVTLPNGRGPQQPSRYVYEDKSGLPHELQVCLVTTNWAVPTGDPAVNGRIPMMQQPHTVLRIKHVTPDLARQLSNMIDGRVDAGLGNLREQGYESQGQSADWSVNATQGNTGGTAPELQSAEVSAELLLR